MPYYNTNRETGGEPHERTKQQKNKKRLVLAVFETYPNEPLTPDDVHNFIKENSDDPNSKLWPITSIRRAISDLTKNSKLYKTDIKKTGSYGKRVHCWIKV